MKNRLGMSYCKIQKTAVHLNSVKNLVLRQQFSVQCLDIFRQDKIILNVDETWLGMTNFKQMKWRAKGTTNSVPVVTMLPRITMIAGLDTQGRVYVSLIQGNSNDQTMDIFFRHLCMKLDRERPNWR